MKNNGFKIIAFSMKKFLFALVILLAVNVEAQPPKITLPHDMRLKGIYFVYNWPEFDSVILDDGSVKYQAYVASYSFNYGAYKADAYYQFSEDTLEVYGIAVGFVKRYLHRLQSYRDWPSYAYWLEYYKDVDKMYFYPMLYAAETDSLRELVDTVGMKVAAIHVPQYILDLDLWYGGIYQSRKSHSIDMYERYFQEPVKVVDSFYVGRKYRESNFMESDIGLSRLMFNDRTHPIRCASYIDWVDSFGRHYKGWDYDKERQMYFIIFPILTPPDSSYHLYYDTTRTDTTQAGLIDVGMVARYTTVQPNPATERVRVLSSFGLEAIVAYDEAGRQVYGGKAAGMAADIDVSAWSRGLYLLHVTTGAGKVVKKLLLQ